jgi:hypothetical protein
VPLRRGRCRRARHGRAALVLAVAEARVVAAGTGSRRERGRWPAVELPAAAAPPLDRLGFTVSVGWRRQRSSCRVPLAPPSFITQRDGGPPATQRAGAPPIWVRVRGGPSGPLGADGLSEINITRQSTGPKRPASSLKSQHVGLLWPGPSRTATAKFWAKIRLELSKHCWAGNLL